MNSVSGITKENCRTCLSYFDENNGKCSLVNCLALSSDSSRLELMKNITSICSLSLFNTNEDQEIADTFICKPCADQIDQMLNFLQKCIHSEEILKQASVIKTENDYVWVSNGQEGNESSVQPKVEIKVEDFSQDENNPNKFVNISFNNACDSCNGSERSKHECQDCHKIFPSALSLTFHRYKHAEYKPHTCIICHENFRTLQLIKKHMAAEHDNMNYQPHLCRQCLEIFSSKYHLTLHVQRVHGNKKYSCGVCKRTFSTISSLKFHENIHLGPLKFPCSFCSELFNSDAKLRDHKKNTHSQIKQFKCQCGRSFNHKKQLNSHIKVVHERKDKSVKHPCPECDKKFIHAYSLKNHINSHLGIKPFLCSACGSAFTALPNLTSHLRRIHSEDKPPAVKKYLCHTCGDSFARASHLQRHTLRKHVPNAEKKHECPICKKKFLEKSDVKGHIKLHDDVKPFVCDQCSKCFRTSWRLQAHVKRVHLGLRPFECPTCLVKFKTKSHLEKHIRTHTGEKPFPCPHCDYTCAEKSNLKKHINVHLKTM